MPGFLFWNLKNKPLQREVAALARERAADIIVLAEYAGTDDEILTALNEGGGDVFTAVPVLGLERIRTFSKLSPQALGLALTPDSPYYTILKLHLRSVGEVLVTVLHGPSKLSHSQRDQDAFVHEVVRDIQLLERESNHRRTVVFGDFNMNPFEEPMVAANGFHAVASQQLAERRNRTVQWRQYWFFYNPMWSFLGDRTPGPPGTYFYAKEGLACYFWNMFDQVLIRPDLLPFLDLDSLAIVTSINDEPLLRPSGPPNRTKFSDHLPIVFSLNPSERSERE